MNRAGPAPVDLSPPEPVDPAEIRRRIHAGEWVVDLRSRTVFACGHLAGTVNLEVGDSFATYLGLDAAMGDPGHAGRRHHRMTPAWRNVGRPRPD